jgi:hypothetical protein
MKKLFQNFNAPVFYSRILFLVLLSFILVQCKKNEVARKEDTVTAQKTAKFKELTTEVLSLAKNAAFKQLVYDECKAQKFGDYYVRLEDLLKNPDAKISVSSEKVVSISKLVNELKTLGARNPIIFYPSVETKEDNKSLSKANRTTLYEDVIAVVDDGTGGGGYTNDQYPGYTFNTDGQLAYTQQINEAFAWENDVWVIGQEEGDPSNDTTLNSIGIQKSALVSSRFDGQSENGGIVQVTDFRYIEPWINGKPEFEYRIYSAAGTLIKHREFPKVKRKDVKSPTWKDFGDFIAYWNISNIGNWTIEGWVEQDNRGGSGNTTTIGQSFPAPCTGCPTTNISYTIKKTDYDMGRTIIQFTDPIAQIYNISYSNIKRKN